MSIRNSVKQFNQAMSTINMRRQRDEAAGKVIDEDVFSEQVASAEEQFGTSILSKEDFTSAVRSSRQSVTDGDLKRYESFRT